MNIPKPSVIKVFSWYNIAGNVNRANQVLKQPFD